MSISQKVFLVWEEVPERTVVYEFILKEKEHIEMISLCHGNFINHINKPEIDEALEWLNNFVATLVPSRIIFDTNLKQSPRANQPIEIEPHTSNILMIVSGFIL